MKYAIRTSEDGALMFVFLEKFPHVILLGNQGWEPLVLGQTLLFMT